MRRNLNNKKLCPSLNAENGASVPLFEKKERKKPPNSRYILGDP
jgi:hypothetical protein